MHYHIFHAEPDLFNFHDWNVDEDFVRQIVRAYFRGIHVVKINGSDYRVGKDLLIYENPDPGGVSGVLSDSMLKLEGTTEGFSKDFFEHRFRNVTDRFLRGRTWGQLKDDFYNIYINDGSNKPVIIVISEQEVDDFLNKWAAGETPIWVSGRRIDLIDPKSIKIYSIDFEWLSDERGVIKSSIKKHVDFMFKGSYKIAALEYFGKDVTDKWDVRPYGKTKSKPSSFDWGIIHPEIYRVANSRFSSGHYADAVEAAFKEINDIIKQEFIKPSPKMTA